MSSWDMQQRSGFLLSYLDLFVLRGIFLYFQYYLYARYEITSCLLTLLFQCLENHLCLSQSRMHWREPAIYSLALPAPLRSLLLHVAVTHPTFKPQLHIRNFCSSFSLFPSFGISSLIDRTLHIIELYRIAGNFRGRKLSRISRFVTIPRKLVFSAKFWGGAFRQRTCMNECNPQRFSPRKSQFTKICESFPLYGIPIKAIEATHCYCLDSQMVKLQC